MASYTENLNLLKKDPVVDGADTFNIETMLNENWDKIDAAKGEIDAALSNKAEKETPQEYDLPLADGVTASSTPRYYRDQFGHVNVYGTVYLSAKPGTSQVIATLPVGYRPTNLTPISLIQGNGWGTLGYVHTTGEIKTYTGAIPDGYATGLTLAIQAEFIAQ